MADMPERNPEIASEEEDDDDGPPPGFQCIITPQPPPAEEQVDEEEGPPPGFDFIAPKPPQSVPSSDIATNSEQVDDADADADGEDDDGPPPGWELSNLANALPKPQSDKTDIESQNNGAIDDEDEDEGPPPGWEMMLPHKMAPQSTPQVQPSTVSFDTEMESKQKDTRHDEETPPSVTQSMPPPVQSLPPTPPPQQLPSSDLPGAKEEDKRNGDKRPSSGHQHSSPLQKPPPTPNPLKPSQEPSSSEKAQLVCGTCQKLCLYPRGAKWVQCPGCQEVNFVLEEHEVGQVKCGGCSVLLMYPHGSPAVQCSSCRFVTEIGAHNMRPPLSVQQSQRRRRRFSRTR